MRNKVTPFITDRTFKKTLQLPDAARDFVRAVLPRRTLALMDIDRLHLAPTEFQQHETGKQGTADMVFQVPLIQAGGTGYVFVVAEHQQRPDPIMPFRMLETLVGICRRHIDTHPKALLPLPLVVPIIVSGHYAAYPYSTNLLDCFADSHRIAVQSFFTESMPLVDLATISDEAISAFQRASLMLYVFKHIKDLSFQQLLDNLVDIINQLKDAPSEIARPFEFVLKYLTERAKGVPTGEALDDVLAEVVAKLPEEVGETVDTVKNILMERGRQQGMQQGRCEGEQQRTKQIAIRMLKTGEKNDRISLYTGLTLLQLTELAEEVE